MGTEMPEHGPRRSVPSILSTSTCSGVRVLVTEYCPKCRQKVEAEHTEVECLRGQVKVLTADRDSWKEAWWDQRRATGEVAWWWRKPWMRVHLEHHLGLGPMNERHGCLGCPMVDGKCPHCGNEVGPP